MVEKSPVSVTNKVKHFTLCKRRNLVAVLTVPIENAINFDLAVKQDKEIILVSLVGVALATHEFDMLLFKEFFVFPLEVTIY